MSSRYCRCEVEFQGCFCTKKSARRSLLDDHGITQQIHAGAIMQVAKTHTCACSQEDAQPEIINHASGDEVDASLIIPGGRRARKGRPQPAKQYKYQQKLADSDEDSW